jgi:hypothetical protein
MTPSEEKLWSSVIARSAVYAAELRQAILDAFSLIRDQMNEREIARAVELGRIDLLFAEALDRAARDLAYRQIRESIRRGILDGVKFYARDLPRGGRIDGKLSIGFDLLNPRMIDAVRELETRVITTLDQALVDTVKAYVENGIRDGVNPRTVARSLRSVLGLAPNQELAVRNYEKALRGENPNASPTDYLLRDKRFDRTVAKGDLSEQQIETMVAAYRKRMLAFNAETNARTAALDAQKLAQRLSWEDAIQKGIVSRDRMQKTWIGVLDERERETHVKMEGVTVGFDEPFILPDGTPQQIPGDTEFNCRCIARYSQARA